MENSIYQSPESDLASNVSSDDITQMKRFSAWGVFGLSIITFGIYNIYWLYNRAQSLNDFHERKINKNVLVSFLVIVIFSYAIQIVGEFISGQMDFTILLLIVNIAYISLYLVIAYSIRSRVMDISGNHIGPILTFFFSSIYLQYSINKAIDESTGNSQ